MPLVAVPVGRPNFTVRSPLRLPLRVTVNVPVSAPGSDASGSVAAIVTVGRVATIIVTSSLLLSSPSFAVRRNTYVPLAEKLAVVESADVLPKVTVPGPLNLLHVVVKLRPAGRPSSDALPIR